MKNYTDNQEFYIAHIAEMKEMSNRARRLPVAFATVIGICSIAFSFLSPFALIGLIVPATIGAAIITINQSYKPYFDEAKITKKEYKELKKSGQLNEIRKRVMELETKIYKSTENTIDPKTYSRTSAYLSQLKQKEQNVEDRTTISTRKGKISRDVDKDKVEEDTNNLNLNN